jgi:hypothetical protein
VQDVPATLHTSFNAGVLAYLADKSAHGDIAGALVASVAPLGDVQAFCPDAGSYRYVLVSTRGVVFGLAVGMATIAFRLDPKMRARALSTGGLLWPECGEDWVAVAHRRPDDDWPALDLTFWARKAYVHARALKA